MRKSLRLQRLTIDVGVIEPDGETPTFALLKASKVFHPAGLQSSSAENLKHSLIQLENSVGKSGNSITNLPLLDFRR